MFDYNFRISMQFVKRKCKLYPFTKICIAETEQWALCSFIFSKYTRPNKSIWLIAYTVHTHVISETICVFGINKIIILIRWFKAYPKILSIPKHNRHNICEYCIFQSDTISMHQLLAIFCMRNDQIIALVWRIKLLSSQT